MAALYEIAADYKRLFDSLEEMEANAEDISPEEIGQAWYDTLEGMEAELGDKAENLVRYIKNISAEAEALKAEENRLYARRKSKENRVKGLKDYLKNCMELAEVTKLETPHALISLRKNPESAEITDEQAFVDWAIGSGNKDMLRYKSPEVDKKAVKSALQEGMEIPGVRLSQGKSIIIK